MTMLYPNLTTVILIATTFVNLCQITRLQHIQYFLARIVLKAPKSCHHFLSYALFTGSE